MANVCEAIGSLSRNILAPSPERLQTLFTESASPRVMNSPADGKILVFSRVSGTVVFICGLR
jgi:hypothetical protein